jgi:RNase P/RNase MRP subunit POP5
VILATRGVSGGIREVTGATRHHALGTRRAEVGKRQVILATRGVNGEIREVTGATRHVNR